MMKFLCEICKRESTKYVTYSGIFTGIIYCESYCTVCFDELGSDYYDVELAKEDYLARKAMEAL